MPKRLMVSRLLGLSTAEKPLFKNPMKKFHKIAVQRLRVLFFTMVLAAALSLITYLVAVTNSYFYLNSNISNKTAITFLYADQIDRNPSIEVNSPVDHIQVEVITRVGVKKFFHASANFELDGRMNTMITAPLSGSYSGIHASGLFWSRRVKSWNIKILLKYAKLNRGERFIIVTDGNGKLLAKARAKFPKILDYPNRKQLRVNGHIYNFYEPRNKVISRVPIILVSGSNSSSLNWEANFFASKGSPVLTILPLPHLGTKCLHNLDPQKMNPAIKQFVKSVGYTGDKIIMVGISAGGTAALLYEPDNNIPEVKRFILSPLPLHLNGATGPGCAFPAPFWEGHSEYQDFYSNDLVGWKNFLFFKMGLMDQRSVIENMLSKKTDEEISKLSFMTKIPADSKIFMGSDDGLIPTHFNQAEVCRAPECTSFEDAGHFLLYSGHNIVGCSSFIHNCSKNQTATFEAQKLILNEILRESLTTEN